MICQQRLAEKYRPESLAEVVGQPAVNILRSFAARPYSRCFLFTGPPGVGKSCAAQALAADIGAVDSMSGYDWTTGAELTKENVERRLRSLWTRPFNGRWNVLVIEELERLSDEARGLLQTGLESAHLPPSAIVLATSNNTAKVGKALLHRFGAPLEFRGWTVLAGAGAARIAWAWCQETDGAPLPKEAIRWGWEYDENGRAVAYSVRMAFDAMEQALLLSEEVAA